MQTVAEHLEGEEVTKEEIAKELQTVRQDYQNEMLALDHARKLAR